MRKTELIQLRATPEFKKRVKKAAYDSNQTLSDWVTMAILEHLKCGKKRAQ